ncbi:ion transporter [Aquisphaera insulae]|uniref:ion transporter n=1 Tax=Aquisphaera insulae TaxID=2712864 RepID=UPI0013EC76A1|nr:ion transporter [Aquisphaera insulae]
MSWASPEVEDWTDRAHALVEAAEGGDGLTLLHRRLDLLGEGFRLRQATDAKGESAGPGPGEEQARESALRALILLQRAVLEQVDAEIARSPDVEPDPFHAEGEDDGRAEPATARAIVAARVKEWLPLGKAALRSLVADHQVRRMGRALAVHGMRGDLEWLSDVVARLDGEPASVATAALEVDLGRIDHDLRAASAAGRPEQLRERDRLIAWADALRRLLLGRRVRRELAWPAAGMPPERLLTMRLQLSRLEATVEALDDGERSREWAEALAVRRADLADRAAAAFRSMDPADARRHCDRCVQATQDEVSEAIAFVEDMPLRRAVSRLELAGQDLDQLAIVVRPLADEEQAAEARAPDPAIPAPRTTSQAAEEELEEVDEARARTRRQLAEVRRLRRRVHGEWQEKLLALRLRERFGRRAVRLLESAVLWLIVGLLSLVAAEAALRHGGRLTPAGRAAIAWADLVVCSLLLAEFGLRLALAPERWRYFRRHFAIDLLASLPLGFLAYLIEADEAEVGLAQAEEAVDLLQFLQVGRLVQVLRVVRIILPALRVLRLGLFALRLGDRLVRRHAGLLNRNVVLFEPYHAHRAESSDRHVLAALRAEQEHAATLVASRLGRAQRLRLASRGLADLGVRIRALPGEAFDDPTDPGEARDGREIPVEALVDRMIQLTPEQLVDRMGPGFVTSADRYLRLLDAPGIRRLPVVRNLVAYRQKSPAEAAALAANYMGHLVQQALEVVYFLADLQGTVSPAVFLDRLGAALVSATRNPAKRLLWLGSAFLLLFLLVNGLAVFRPFRGFVDKLQDLLGWPVIILGGICLVFWLLGAWFRKIANQSADFSERVVEAQFVAQTRTLKSLRREEDGRFLLERVIDPEFLLRSSDNRRPGPERRADATEAVVGRGGAAVEDRELSFLRNVGLLYQDYLDGSPFHRSDTRASVQLLGNLALTNMRRSHLGHLLREGRTIDRLDLNRAGRVLGGPYLWFNYITRMIVQETAILLLDYNRHAIPLDRLACSPEGSRRGFREWLARRLRVEPDEIFLPPTAGQGRAAEEVAGPADGAIPRRPEADAFMETVEFTAIDFLAADPVRDAAIRRRFGPQVADLVRRDRRQNVRRAFRSYPLHELPLARRTINPYAFYEAHLSRGRIVLLPFLILIAAARMVTASVRGVHGVVEEILHPEADPVEEIPADTYATAIRKIHRMRKPVLMGSLWLRARFDVEYLGLPLPTAPPELTAGPLIEGDLDYIRASRQDRIVAEQIRMGHSRRLQWIGRWLERFGWTFDGLPAFLAAEIPYLSDRGGEALRALVAACVLDHDDIATLASSIEGLARVMTHGADPEVDISLLPPNLPDPVINLRRLWHPVPSVRRPAADLFNLPCFSSYGPAERGRILAYMKRHRRAVRGWVKVVLGQGGADPWAVVRARMREVLLRTDLWSDQIIVLRAVQTLALLDVQHNCNLVRSLGDYDAPTRPTRQ